MICVCGLCDTVIMSQSNNLLGFSDKMVSFGCYPDHLDTTVNPKLELILSEYEKKVLDLKKWFWDEVQSQTSLDEQKVIRDKLFPSQYNW